MQKWQANEKGAVYNDSTAKYRKGLLRTYLFCKKWKHRYKIVESVFT